MPSALRLLLLGLAACTALPRPSAGTASLPPPQRLRTERLADPPSVRSDAAVRLEWQSPWPGASTDSAHRTGGPGGPIHTPPGSLRGLTQTVFQLQLTDVLSGSVVYDSGAQNSTVSSFVLLPSQNLLQVHHTYSWQVRWWASDGSGPSEYSQPATFGVGPSNNSAWAPAVWIGGANQRQLRAELTLAKAVKLARAYIAAPGCHTLSVNNASVSAVQGIMCPWLQYNKRILYQTHDITSLLVAGNNTLDMLLGHGFWSSYALYPMAKVLIHIVYSDGTTTQIVSHPNSNTAHAVWSAQPGPITRDDPFAGTTIDWRLWTADNWQPLQLPNFNPVGTLLPMNMPEPVLSSTVTPVNMTVLPDGHVVYDMGVNLVGVCALSLQGPDGAMVTLKHGERIWPNGSVDTNLGHDIENFQKDIHILSSSGPTSMVPVFTWHGFQYVELYVANFTGFAPSLDILTAWAVNSGLESTGSLSFEDDAAGLLSRCPGVDPTNPASVAACNADVQTQGDGFFLHNFFRIVWRTQLNNLADNLPTDCPTREKHGWLGDAQVSGQEAMLTFDTRAIHVQYLYTIRDSQSASGDVAGAVPVNANASVFESPAVGGGYTDISWSAAYPLILSWYYQYTGDVHVVADMYPSVKAYVDNLVAASKTVPGGVADFYTWGDWCAVQDRDVATPATGPELAAFNYILSLDAMVQLAQALGNNTEAQRYQTVGTQARTAFHTKFYNASASLYNGGYDVDAQSLTAAPLVLGNTIPPPLLNSVLTALAENVARFDGHLTYGSVGARHVLPALSSNGMYATAMAMMTQRTFPSFGYWMANGATTCWENWSGVADGSHPPQPTHGHIFLCAGGIYNVYTQTAGITPLAPGFAQVRVAPQVLAVAGPASTTASLVVPAGNLTVAWQRKNINATAALVALTVQLPVGTTAQVRVPVVGFSPSDIVVYESGTKVWDPTNGGFQPGVAGITSGTAVPDGVQFNVRSGSYSFSTGGV